MHMATAVGTPVVSLFGPTVEAFGFFPYTPAGVGCGAPASLPALHRAGKLEVPSGPSPLHDRHPAEPGVRRCSENLAVNGWDPAASALLSLLPGGGARPQARRNLCAVAYGSGRAGFAARSSTRRPGSASPGSGARAASFQSHHAATTEESARCRSEPAARCAGRRSLPGAQPIGCTGARNRRARGRRGCGSGGQTGAGSGSSEAAGQVVQPSRVKQVQSESPQCPLRAD